MNNFTKGLIAAFLPIAGLAVIVNADSKPQVVEMKLKPGSTTLDLGFGNSQWLYPHKEPKETLQSQPKYKSNNPIYYAAKYGDAKDNTFTFVIDESGGPGTGYDTLYVDADNDNRIDPQKERFTFQLGPEHRVKPLPVKLLVTSGGKTFPYCLQFTAFPYSDEKRPKEKVHANLRNSPYYIGEAVFAGKTYKIALADLNNNGLFNDVEMGIFRGDRFFVDLNCDGNFRNDMGDQWAGFPYARYTKIGKQWYTIIASPDGSRIEITAVAPPLGEVKAPPMVVSADLRSTTQACHLDFTKGPAQGIDGTYSVRSIRLKARDANDWIWQTTGRFPDKACPNITLRAGETVELKAGNLPLTVQPKISGKNAGEILELGVEFKGPAGEIYRWPRHDCHSVKAPQPVIEVHDENGIILVSATQEYG